MDGLSLLISSRIVPVIEQPGGSRGRLHLPQLEEHPLPPRGYCRYEKVFNSCFYEQRCPNPWFHFGIHQKNTAFHSKSFRIKAVLYINYN